MIIENLEIPLHHPCFAGHFPDNPIVPGALLLQWIIAAAKARGLAEKVDAVKTMKFLNPVKPGDHCTIEFNIDTVRISVICRRGNTLICRGVLCRGQASTGAIDSAHPEIEG
ncbi:MAG: hypothetical protein P8Y45_13660 [Exilibacterium sp.]